MKLDVLLTAAAEHDLDNILFWLSQRSPKGAETWYRRWLEAARFLRDSATGCSLAPESHQHSEEIRQFIFKTRHGRPYRAVFIVRDDKVLVLHIRVAGQDLIRPEDMRLPEPDSPS